MRCTSGLAHIRVWAIMIKHLYGKNEETLLQVSHSRLNLLEIKSCHPFTDPIWALWMEWNLHVSRLWSLTLPIYLLAIIYQTYQVFFFLTILFRQTQPVCLLTWPSHLSKEFQLLRIQNIGKHLAFSFPVYFHIILHKYYLHIPLVSNLFILQLVLLLVHKGVNNHKITTAVIQSIV